MLPLPPITLPGFGRERLPVVEWSVFQVGSVDRLKPRRSGRFSVRFVGGNGRVLTGEGNDSRNLFPSQEQRSPEATPEENHISIAMVLAFGTFRYFAGGDLVADRHDGAFPWLDVETPIVTAAGTVDVASADHHGYFNACSAAFVRSLDADAYVIQAWHATHPAMATLQRMANAWHGRSTKDVFITRLDPASRAVNARFLPQVKSFEGHVVVRVQPDGRYRLFVTDSRDERDTSPSPVNFEHQSAHASEHVSGQDTWAISFESLTAPGTRSGTTVECRRTRRIDVAGDRFARVEKLCEFTLASWRPSFEDQFGKPVSELVRWDGIS